MFHSRDLRIIELSNKIISYLDPPKLLNEKDPFISDSVSMEVANIDQNDNPRSTRIRRHGNDNNHGEEDIYRDSLYIYPNL